MTGRRLPSEQMKGMAHTVGADEGNGTTQTRLEQIAVFFTQRYEHLRFRVSLCFGGAPFIVGFGVAISNINFLTLERFILLNFLCSLIWLSYLCPTLTCPPSPTFSLHGFGDYCIPGLPRRCTPERARFLFVEGLGFQRAIHAGSFPYSPTRSIIWNSYSLIENIHWEWMFGIEFHLYR